jgi:hypothetical protein
VVASNIPTPHGACWAHLGLCTACGVWTIAFRVTPRLCKARIRGFRAFLVRFTFSPRSVNMSSVFVQSGNSSYEVCDLRRAIQWKYGEPYSLVRLVW